MFYKNIVNHLVRAFVGLIWALVVVVDIITFVPWFLIQRHWRHWKEAHAPCSKHVTAGDGYVVRGPMVEMPKHYLRHCKTIDEALVEAVKQNGRERDCVGFRKILDTDNSLLVNGKVFPRHKLSEYHWLNYGQLFDRVRRFGHGLAQQGAAKQDKVIIYADTSLPWFISAQGIIANGSVLVTLYATLSDQGVVQGMNETEAKYLITSKALVRNTIDNQDEIPKLTHVILLDVDEGSEEFDNIRSRLKSSIKLCTFEQLIEAGDVDFLEHNPVHNQEDELAVIMYTSGSGGIPKGVMMTHKNFLVGVMSALSIVELFARNFERHVYIGYLPLAHILEFGVQNLLIFAGCRVGYSSPHTMLDVSQGLMEGTKGDATLLQPTVMASVPLVLDRIRKAIFTSLNEKGLLVVKFFEFLFEYKNFWVSRGFRTPLLDALFLKKFSAIVGGRLEILLTGGAPLSADTQKVIRAALNVTFSQGYGTTEMVCGGLFMNHLDQTLAKVGGPMHGILVKLVDWQEGGYLTADQPNPRGEIHVATESLSIGYYKLPKLDAESYYVDEAGVRWFRTGDVGELFPNGSFKIIDRKKDFLKLQFGEFVSLGKIETKLKTSYLINNVCVVGNSLYKYLIAVVVPNPKIMEKFYRRLNAKAKNLDLADMYGNIKLKQLFYRKLVDFCRQNGLRKYEIPKDVILVADEWSPDTGLVTASFKLKRKNIEQFYLERIQETFTNVSLFD